MKKKLFENELKKIREEVEKEFPEDMALQEIHIARKIIARELMESGKSYFEYLQLWKEKQENKIKE